MTTSRKAKDQVAKYRTQDIERQNIEVVKHRSRKISKAKYRTQNNEKVKQ